MSAQQLLIRWCLFFAICVGLGYPTLQRYDPRMTGGLTDADEYYALVATTDLWAPHGTLSDEDPRPRLLVPLTARLINSVVHDHTGSVDSALLSLLIANALYCATLALLLVLVGNHVTNDDAVSLVAALLYLLSFAVSNYYLAALVDAGEACLLLLLVWALMTGRWHWLPLIGMVGVLAKETFAPLAAVYSTVWYWRMAGLRLDRRALWWTLLNASAIGTLIVLWSWWYRDLVLPWSIASSQHGLEGTFWTGLWRCLFNHGMLYLFGWLLPLGVWRLKQLPSAWVLPVMATSGVVLLMGAWDDSGSNIARELFNVCGALLTLSVALLLTGKPAAPR